MALVKVLNAHSEIAIHLANEMTPLLFLEKMSRWPIHKTCNISETVQPIAAKFDPVIVCGKIQALVGLVKTSNETLAFGCQNDFSHCMQYPGNGDILPHTTTGFHLAATG